MSIVYKWIAILFIPVFIIVSILLDGEGYMMIFAISVGIYGIYSVCKRLDLLIEAKNKK